MENNEVYDRVWALVEIGEEPVPEKVGRLFQELSCSFSYSLFVAQAVALQLVGRKDDVYTCSE